MSQTAQSNPANGTASPGVTWSASFPPLQRPAPGTGSVVVRLQKNGSDNVKALIRVFHRQTKLGEVIVTPSTTPTDHTVTLDSAALRAASAFCTIENLSVYVTVIFDCAATGLPETINVVSENISGCTTIGGSTPIKCTGDGYWIARGSAACGANILLYRTGTEDLDFELVLEDPTCCITPVPGIRPTSADLITFQLVFDNIPAAGDCLCCPNGGTYKITMTEYVP